MYSIVSANDPIRQGDIFRWLPKINIILGEASLPILTEPEDKGGKLIDWLQFAKTTTSTDIPPEKQIKTADVVVNSVHGIIISQDCDVSRIEYIVFAEIKPLNKIKIFKDWKEPPEPNKVIDVVTKHTQLNQKFYFLSNSDELNFNTKMAVDFDSIFEVDREMLINHIELLRIGRLADEVAWPHFRERVAEFFRRYPYNEWYPLNSEEVHAYIEKQRKSDPNFILDPIYRWQGS